jgi:hypothetical protein
VACAALLVQVTDEAAVVGTAAAAAPAKSMFNARAIVIAAVVIALGGVAAYVAAMSAMPHDGPPHDHVPKDPVTIEVRAPASSMVLVDGVNLGDPPVFRVYAARGHKPLVMTVIVDHTETSRTVVPDHDQVVDFSASQ